MSLARAAGESRRQPRRLKVQILSVAVLAAMILAIDVAAVVLHQSVTPISVASAVQAFREGRGEPAVPSASTTTIAAAGTSASPVTQPSRSQPAQRPAVGGQRTASSPAAATSNAPALPGEGVYVYATDGGEQTAPPTPFPQESHSYPSQSTVTARAAGCGMSYRWAPLAERFDSWNVCPVSEGMRLVSVTEHFEFYNHTDEQTYSCTGDSLDFTMPQPASGGYQASCTSGGSAGTGASGFRIDGQVRGVDTMTVGGQSVRAVHVVEQLVANGSTTGQTTRERWLDERNGLLLRLISTSDTKTDSTVGNVTYHESINLLLTSLTPQT